ncbi:MAG: hypothetical protein IIC26_01965 [Chloroflexi bacterium]|nr:hypothetical protein [Chloroflexota bacterium]
MSEISLSSAQPGGLDYWGKVEKLAASDAQAGDVFGSSVALSRSG